MINQIIQGDCLELMKQIPDHSVDMILSDPPYGSTAPEWDKIIDFDMMWKEYLRIIKKDRCICLFAAQPFTSMLINSNIKKYRYCWYWKKNQGTNFFHAKRMPIRKIEEILIFNSKIYHPQITDGHIPTNSAKGVSSGQVYFGTNTRNESGGKTTRYPDNILEFKCVNNYSRQHTSQKPVDLLEYLIKTYTDKDDLVLDNTCGAGSTCVAAQNLNRRFIGMDLSEEYCEISRKRLNI